MCVNSIKEKMDGDLSDRELQKRLQRTNKVFAKKMNASLRGSTDEFVPLVIPAIQHGGRLFVSHPIGAGEAEGGSFMDFINTVKDVASMPLKLATMPLQMIKSAVMGSGENCEEQCEDGAGLFDTLRTGIRGTAKGLVESGFKKGQQSQLAPVAPVAPVEGGSNFLYELTHIKSPFSKGNGKPRKPRTKKGGADAVYAKVQKKPKVVLDPAYADLGKVEPVYIPKVINESTHDVKLPRVMNESTHDTVQKGKGKPRKPRAKKGGNLLSTLSDLASIQPAMFDSPLDSFIPREVSRSVAKAIGEKVMGKGGAETGGAKKAKVANPWLEYVRGVGHRHPELKYKDVLILAKKTYHKAK